VSSNFDKQIEELLNDIFYGCFKEFDEKKKMLLDTDISQEYVLHMKAIEGIIFNLKGQHKKALKID